MFKNLFNKKNIFLIILIILISLHVFNFLGFISLLKKKNKEEDHEDQEDPFTLTFPSTTIPLGPLGSIPIKLGSITFNARASASGAMPASVKADAGF